MMNVNNTLWHLNMILARLHHKTRTWRSLMTAYIKKKTRKRQKDQVRRRGNQMGSKLAPDPSRLTPLTSRRRRVLFPQKIEARLRTSESCPVLTS